MVEITDKNFQKDVLDFSKKIPVIVDFWAPWCGPCQYLGPVIDKLAKEYEGKVKIFKMNVDENPETAEKYEVMSIPCVKIFKNGDFLDEFVGIQPENLIKKWIETYI